MPNQAAQTSPLELELLESELRTEFRGLIEGVGNTAAEQDRSFLSKAVAAFTLINEAGATPQDAASAIVDGGGDHGIDAIYVDATWTIWLVQSKFIASGRGEPDLGDLSKFRDGVVDLLAGRYDRFNQAVQAKAPGIAAALSEPHRQVRVVLAHTGGAISDQRREVFADLQRRYNETDPDFLHCTSRFRAFMGGCQRRRSLDCTSNTGISWLKEIFCALRARRPLMMVWRTSCLLKQTTSSTTTTA